MSVHSVSGRERRSKPAGNRSMPGIPRATRRPAATMLIALSWLVAACGAQKPATSGTSAGGQSKQYLDAIKFARCMRAQGAPQLPDPRNPGGFPSAAILALNSSSPAFVSATNRCDQLLPNEGQPTAAQFEQTLVDAVKIARCIRAHGFYFPDPGVIGTQLTLNLANVSNSPQSNKVAQRCSQKVYGQDHY